MTKIQPVFFITSERGHPHLTVDGNGRQGFKFFWEPKFEYLEGTFSRKGAYVLRFKDTQEMATQQFNVLGAQHRWTVYFGVELTETDKRVAFASNAIAKLREEAGQQREQIARLERVLELAESERIQNFRPTTVPGQTAASHIEPEPPTPKMPTYGVDNAVPTPAAPAATDEPLPVHLNASLQDRDLAEIVGDDIPAAPRRPTQTQTAALPSVPQPRYGDEAPAAPPAPPSIPEPAPTPAPAGGLDVPPPPAGLDVPPPPAGTQASTSEDMAPIEAASPIPARPTQRAGRNAKQPTSEPKAL